MTKTFKENQKGSVMIEALAMLGLIAMVTPMLYRKAAERTTELQDINVASQIRMVSAAVDAYLKDNYTNLAGRGDTFLITNNSGATATELADYSGVAAYLPEGFNLDRASKLFEGFEIAVKKDSTTDLAGNTHNIFTSAVVANLKDDMTKMRSAKIASMIGTNGGMVNVSGEGENQTYSLNGTQGTWEATPNAFGFSENPGWKDNSLVSISTEAISSAIGDVGSDEALFRIWNGNTGFNTMETSLYFAGNNNVALEMQGHDINGVSNLIASSISTNDITSGNGTFGSININSGGDLTFRGNGGDINGVNNINMRNENSSIGMNGGKITNVNDITTQGLTADTIKASGITVTNTIEAAQVVGGTIYAGTGGITTSGNLVMNGKNITGVGTISGSSAIFNSVTAESIDANSINVNGELKMNNNKIDMGGGGIEDVGYIAMHDSDSKIDMNGGSIYGVNELEANSIKAEDIVAVSGDFDNLHSKGNLTVGGDVFGTGTRFEVIDDTTLVKTDRFAVGGGTTDAFDGVNKIAIDSDNAFFGYNYDKLRGLYALEEKVAVGYNADSQGNGLFSTEQGNAIGKAYSTGMKVIDQGFVFGEDTTGDMFNFAQDNDYRDIISDDVPALEDRTDTAVYISRKGAIEIKAPSDNEDGNARGFIRARRLVSDKMYRPFEYGEQGEYAYAGEKARFYEVNPAYTSIMNDIKLASRGGARLSDILPDYINKGIYVADNTYREDTTWEDGDSYKPGIYPDPDTGWTMDGAEECDDSKCETSPWLGFVPAPLCPPAYESVITLEPIRWKMAEAYSFGDPSYSYPGGADLAGSGFENVFWANHEILNGMTVNVTEDGGGTHTASFDGTYPFVFQTNTWLNTSVYPYVDDSKYTLGWHAVMGFLYDSSYAEMYKRRTGGNMESGDLVWNLFPVYSQELAAIARVYCSFRRYRDKVWTWGGESDSPVFKYDQLENPRTGKKERYNQYMNQDENEPVEDTGWFEQVNDPSLGGYETEW